MAAYLDTNCVLWLYSGEYRRFSVAARDAIEQFDLLIAPVIQLELQYLYEAKRIVLTPDTIITYLMRTAGARYCEIPYLAVMEAALGLIWTRDPFDRLIVASAIANQNAPLITADRQIRKHYSEVIW